MKTQKRDRKRKTSPTNANHAKSGRNAIAKTCFLTPQINFDIFLVLIYLEKRQVRTSSNNFTNFMRALQ